MGATTWITEGLCGQSGLDPNIWFANPAEAATPQEMRQARFDLCQARGVCRMCPVKTQCLRFALEHPSVTGVWGGLSEEERSTLRRIHNARIRGQDIYSHITDTYNRVIETSNRAQDLTFDAQQVQQEAKEAIIQSYNLGSGPEGRQKIKE